MAHSKVAFDMAQDITQALVEANLIDKLKILKIRGIIQIILEDKYYKNLTE